MTALICVVFFCFWLLEVVPFGLAWKLLLANVWDFHERLTLWLAVSWEQRLVLVRLQQLQAAPQFRRLLLAIPMAQLSL